MKRLLLILLMTCSTWCTYAQDTDEPAGKAKAGQVALENEVQDEPYVNPDKHGIFQGYSGGMMVHLGYGFGQASGFQDESGQEATLRSVTYGIGGAVRIHLLSHLRVGAEGYVSEMPVKSQGDGSNIRTGWGGVLVDAYTKWGRFWPFAGGTLGGGAQRSTHVLTDDNYSLIGSNWAEAWEQFKTFSSLENTYPAEFTKKGFFVFDPFIGGEYAFTQKLHMIIRLDYLICVHKGAFLTPSGPRLYVGFMFNH